MAIENYLRETYEGEIRADLIQLYQKYEGILSGNFYHWENEYQDQPYEKQLAINLPTFLTNKVEQVLKDAKKIRDEELAQEATRKLKEEEAWKDGSQ